MKSIFAKVSFFITITIFFACATPNKVVNLNNVAKIKPNSYIYALPQTLLNIKVTAKKTILKRGPYFQFADKFLGIKEPPTKDNVKWELTNAEIESYTTVDSLQFYYVENGKKPLDLSKLTEKGLILPLHYSQEIITSNNTSSYYDDSKLFKDNATKKNLVKREETVYKTIQRDSGSVTVTSKEKRITTKTLEEKAEEAANAIFKLRKRRIKLIEGIEKASFGNTSRTFAKQYPEGETMKIMLQQMDSLENNLLAMFLGRKYTVYYTYNYQINPSFALEKESSELFYFSENEGIISSNNENKGKPIEIHINYTKLPESLNKLNYKTETYYSFPVYRIPSNSKIRITYDNNQLNNSFLQIYQLGTLVSVACN